MTIMQISAYAIGFAFAALAVLVWMVLALDRIADKAAEERRKQKAKKLT